MKRNVLIMLLILINSSVIFYINFKIETDLSYHYGKDGEVFTGLEMITLLSVFYFLILGKGNKLIFLIVGFFIGILSFIVSYFAIYSISQNDICFYLFAMLLFTSTFHLIEKKRTKLKFKRDNPNQNENIKT